MMMMRKLKLALSTLDRINMVESIDDAGAPNVCRHVPATKTHGFTATRYCMSTCPFVRADTQKHNCISGCDGGQRTKSK